MLEHPRGPNKQKIGLLEQLSKGEGCGLSRANPRGNPIKIIV